MSFYLFLPSNVSPQYFPGNRISAFQVKLPKRIKFNPNEYEVALTEFTYVHCMKTYFSKNDRLVEFTDEIRDGFSDLTFHELPNINYSNPRVLSIEINQLLRSAFGEEIGQMRISKKSKKASLTVKRGRIMITKTIGENLGFSSSYLHRDKVYYVFKEGTHTAEEDPVTLGGMYHIFVYSDIVQPQIVGDSLVPLLRIVNITGKKGDVVTQTFRPYYLPINKLEFDTVEVLLCNEFGEEINFEQGQSIVTLHIRKTK